MANWKIWALVGAGALVAVGAAVWTNPLSRRQVAADQTPPMVQKGEITIPSVQNVLSATTTAMKACVNRPPNEVKGVIRLVVPGNLGFGGIISRPVKFEKPPLQPDPEDGTKDNIGQSNTQNPGGGATIPEQPFHIYLKTPNFGSSGFVLVKVIIRKGQKYHFFDQGGIHGVGKGDAISTTALCDNKLRGAPGDRQVAIFYIDLSQFTSPGDEAPFNIGIVPNAYTETPIFIDPKVRNEG